MYALFLLLAAPVAHPPAAPASARIMVTGMRNAKGTIRICLTRDPAHFPNCGGDPTAITRTVPATAPVVEIGNLAPGTYATAVFHDSNNNGKLDKSLGIPREGFGFSRNPKIHFGPPRFGDVAVAIGASTVREEIHLTYVL